MNEHLKSPYWYLKVNLFVSVIKWLSISFFFCMWWLDVSKTFNELANADRVKNI